MTFIELAGAAIIDKLKSVLDQDVAVTDLGGVIVADSQIKNFGKTLPTTTQAIRENKTIVITDKELGNDKNAWATPLIYDNQIVGSLVLLDNGKLNEERVALARSLAELLIHQVMVLRMLPTTSQVLDKFFYDLFEGQAPLEKLLEESRFLDIHYYKVGLDADRIVILVNLPGFWQTLLGTNLVPQEDDRKKVENYKQRLRAMFKPYVEKEEDVLVTYFSGDNFIILLTSPHPGETSKNLAKDLEKIYNHARNTIKENIKLALPNFHSGLDGLVKGYGEAKTTLNLGLKLYPDRNVYIYSDIILPRLISQIPQPEQEYFINYYLKNLLKKPQLLKTLGAYFSADLDLRATAQKLNIHKNTLYYRFDKIQKLIGLNPRSFHNSLKIVLALLMYQINPGSQEGSSPNPGNQINQFFG